MKARNENKGEIVVDLFDLLRYLWQRKISIVCIALLGALIAGIMSYNMRNIYKTEVLLAPVENNDGAFSQLAGKFGGLASFAGIGLGKNNQFLDESIALMTSREILIDFINDNNLKPTLFYKKWDKEKGKWKQNGFLSRTLKKMGFGSEKNKPRKHYQPNEPTDSATYQLFSEKFIQVTQEKKTSLITVTVKAYSPEDAVNWATEIVHRVNEHLRQAKKSEAEKSIDYLETASKQTGVVEMKAAIYQLIESQTKAAMFANVKEEFAFRTVDPAYFPEKKASPRRNVMILAGAFLGGLCATAYLFFCHVRAIRRASSN